MYTPPPRSDGAARARAAARANNAVARAAARAARAHAAARAAVVHGGPPVAPRVLNFDDGQPPAHRAWTLEPDQSVVS